MTLFGGSRGRFGMGFGLPSDTQQAVDQYAAMPAQQAPQRDWGRGLSDIGTGLMAAQAALDGNFGMSAELSSSIGAEQRRLAKEAEQAHRNRMEWVWRQQYEAANRQQNPYRWEDNAGNVWERGPDGQNRRIFTDRAERTVIGANGQMITVPNPFLNEEGPPPTAPVGKLTPLNGGATSPAAPPFGPRRLGMPLLRR